VTDLAYLISRSCTTGWLDWVHGELWLLPDGLVRTRIGWGGSFGNAFKTSFGRTVPHQLPQRPAGSFDQNHILAAHRTNKILPFAYVAAAELYRGWTAHGLRITMTGGDKHLLMWLVRDPAHEILSQALPAALHNRLTMK
jgi:hypothetical protein